jgi:SAM-dependent methyltransferase
LAQPFYGFSCGISMNSTDGWDSYWSGSQSGAAYGQEGIDHPLLAAHWRRLLATVKSGETVLDVASGRGALAAFLRPEQVDLVSVDFSSAALRSQTSLFPAIKAVAADVRQLPFGDGGIDRIISQYGIEYGGVDAIPALIRLIRPGGRIQLVLHMSGSVIDSECQANVDALARLEASQFLTLAAAMFEAGFLVLKGESGPEIAREKAVPVISAHEELGAILRQYGEGIAGGTIKTLFMESAKMQERLPNYVEAEVMEWLASMARETVTYKQRMQSMVGAAISEEVFKLLMEKFRAAGMTIEEACPIKDDADQALGWSLSVVAT